MRLGHSVMNVNNANLDSTIHRHLPSFMLWERASYSSLILLQSNVGHDNGVRKYSDWALNRTLLGIKYRS